MSDERAVAALEKAHPHDPAWRDLRLKSATLWRLLAACLPVFFVAYVMGLALGQPWLYPLATIAWLAAIGWAGARMARFACPRCGGAFFETWYYFKPLRRACAHCGLLRGPTEDARPAPTAVQH